LYSQSSLNDEHLIAKLELQPEWFLCMCEMVFSIFINIFTDVKRLVETTSNLKKRITREIFHIEIGDRLVPMSYSV